MNKEKKIRLMAALSLLLSCVSCAFAHAIDEKDENLIITKTQKSDMDNGNDDKKDMVSIQGGVRSSNKSESGVDSTQEEMEWNLPAEPVYVLGKKKEEEKEQERMRALYLQNEEEGRCIRCIFRDPRRERDEVLRMIEEGKFTVG